MQARHLAQHEHRLREQDESMRLHEQRMAHVDMRLSEITDKLDGLRQVQAKSLPQHERQLLEQTESMRLHQQRMDHIDMRLAEITDKLDGMIGFMGGYFSKPQ